MPPRTKVHPWVPRHGLMMLTHVSAIQIMPDDLVLDIWSVESADRDTCMSMRQRADDC